MRATETPGVKVGELIIGGVITTAKRIRPWLETKATVRQISTEIINSNGLAVIATINTISDLKEINDEVPVMCASAGHEMDTMMQATTADAEAFVA